MQDSSLLMCQSSNLVIASGTEDGVVGGCSARWSGCSRRLLSSCTARGAGACVLAGALPSYAHRTYIADSHLHCYTHTPIDFVGRESVRSDAKKGSQTVQHTQ